jgi:hypothetical protein
MRTVTCAVAALSFFYVAPTQSAPADIGAAAIVKNSVTASIDANTRTMKPGDRVHQNESIVTGKESGTQLLFRDETIFTLGPDSRAVLDTFVYDPDKRIGKVSIRAVTGAFRFVSGSQQKNAYEIKTRMGTVGVRGTIVQLWLTENQLKLQVDEGGATFCNAQTCVELDKPGTYVVVTSQQIGEARSTRGPTVVGNTSIQEITTEVVQNQYLQFLDTQKFSSPPSAPLSEFLPDGTRRRPRP